MKEHLQYFVSKYSFEEIDQIIRKSNPTVHLVKGEVKGGQTYSYSVKKKSFVFTNIFIVSFFVLEGKVIEFNANWGGAINNANCNFIRPKAEHHGFTRG